MRTYNLINDNWKFLKENVSIDNIDISKAIDINIPHTWNNIDGQDGGGDYIRDSFWYIKELGNIDFKDDEEIYIEFNGVNSSSYIYINDEFVGEHHGGYSRFRFNITPFIKDNNILKVLVDNKETDKVYPQTADFTFYGGIYRDVKLIKVKKDHFELDFYGSSGIFFNSQKTGNLHSFSIKTLKKGDFLSTFELYDKDNNLVVKGDTDKEYSIDNIVEYQGKNNPYLYKLVVLGYKGNELIDRVEDYVGFLDYKVDGKKGFILNDQIYPLRGVAKHQDWLGLGNAISKENIETDINFINEIGATSVRLAHYQHDDYTYYLCDKFGIFVWAEIPYISRHMENANDNAISQMKELIYQTYNHPSIVIRGLSNEITMKKGKGRYELNKKLNDLVHEIDPKRITSIANYSTMTSTNKMAHIADSTSMNFYHGWYTPFTWLNRIRLGTFHFLYKNYPLGFSEYGSEGMPNLHSERPRRGDNTEEYQLICHYKIYKDLNKMKYLFNTYVWNMFDFAADARNVGGDPGKNHKGLVTFDRKLKKDAFYLYKSYWSDEEVLHIASKRFVYRNKKHIKVYIVQNTGDLDIFLNDKLIKHVKSNKNLITIKIPLKDNSNIIKVKHNDIEDVAEFIYTKEKHEEYKLHVKSQNHTWQKK